MANYNVDIAVALKGAQKLTAFNKDVKTTKLQVDGLNKTLKNIAKDQQLFIRSFENLNTVLRDAKTSFNAVASGTLMQKKAARELVVAERNLNKEYQQRERLLESIRRNQSGFAQFSRSASQVSSPAVFDTATQKSIDRNRRNQNRIAGRTPVPFGPQPFIGPLPMQGPMFGPMQGPMPMMTVNNNPRILRNLEASRMSREASGFGIRPGTQYERPIGPAFSAVMKAQLRHQKKIDKNTGKTAQLLSASNNRAIFGNPNQFATPIGPQPARPSFLNTMGFGQGANPRGIFANSRGRRGRLAGATSNALIGGGFPLLFGQGALGAVGGGIGGALGGALGGGFGFGLSIAGTAIASRIQETIDFRKAVDKLNVSIQATGGTSTFTAKQVAEFAKSLGMTKDEALEALKAFKQFEASARITLLKTFGSEGTFDIFAGLKNNASIISALPGLSKELGINQAISALETLKSKDATAAQDQLLGNIISKNKEIIKQESKKVGFFEKLNPFRGKFKLNDPSKGILGGGGFMTVEELEEFKAKNAGAEFDSLIVQAKERLRLQRQFNEELERQAIIKAPVDELNRLLDPLTQIDQLGKSIGNSFSESFKGIVKGSMTAQEALRNLFMRTADHFLDMAAQILAAQIRSGIFGLFSSFLNPTFGTGMGSNPAGMRQQGVGVTANRLNRHVVGHSSIQPKANGGPVMAGGGYLVGERGPELFSPGVSGTITPNEMLGGSTNIVVNVDASGSSVEGDEEEGRELGRLISVAIQSELIKQKRPGGMLA